ncbi:MAG: response regulator [Clostridia bacterium]|nr:response regulator [Clostridia bacterium]
MYSVLIVDDCYADIVGLMENIEWEAFNCRVTATASNGTEGVLKAIETEPDIIITDVSMPEMDGISMTKKLRQKLPDTSFIFISCFDEFKYIKGAMDENASAYVLKPIELEELNAALTKVTARLDKTNNLKSGIKRHIGTLTENFLSDLLFNKDCDSEYATLLGIPLGDTYRAILLRFEGADKMDSVEIYSETSSLKQKIWNMLPSERCFVLEFGINSLVILVHQDILSEEDFLAYLKKVEKMSKSSNMTASLSYDSNLCELRNISLTFTKLVQEGRQQESNIEMSDLYKKLSIILFSPDTKDIYELIDKLFPQKYYEDINYSRTTSVQIISTVSLILGERKLSFGNIFGEEFMVWNKLFDYKSLINIRQWVSNVLKEIHDYLINDIIKTDKHESIVTRIKSFIDLNFPSPTIIEDVSDEVHLSAKHANSIFKNATGQTLFSYAVQKRINYAKELMQDTSLSVSDIAQAVGYTNSAYFATAFRNNTGFSPTQYRNNFVN